MDVELSNCQIDFKFQYIGLSGSSGSDGMVITREKRAKSATHENNHHHKKRDRNYRSSSVVSASESDRIRKTSSSSVSQYKVSNIALS